MTKKEVKGPSALHPSFWDGEPVSASSALIDKCDVNIGGLFFQADRHTVTEWVPNLAQINVSADRNSECPLFENGLPNPRAAGIYWWSEVPAQASELVIPTQRFRDHYWYENAKSSHREVLVLGIGNACLLHT